ncbi:M4 family metallopeptidase, partial [Arsukibacterium sp.]|uniref:M4 family metallopeptidase n=1 Tax=Arsukibacterium sp. TaxID=1977258 RepID=UPI002FD9AC79
QASTTASQKLATLFDQVGRFMAEHFGSAQFDPVDNSIVYAFVGSKMFHHQHGASVSCAGSSTNPNAFFAVVSNAFGEELGLVQVHSPLLQNPEVIMHELAHGIIAFSSELVYLGESGALNEAFSDIAGVSFVAWLNNRLAAPEQTDWLIRLVSTVIRDFRFPQRANNNPDHYLERYVGTKNNGGVHINSSIVNHAFYLLAEGGSHRRLGGVEVPKIGMQKALKIWHYATTKIMTPTSDFRNARYAVAEAAEIIYGQYSPERTAVHKAFDAVGIKGSWSENVPPKPVPIPLPEPDIKPQPEPIPAPSPQPKAEVPEVKVPPVTPTPPSAPVAAFSQLHFFIAFAAVMSALGLLLLLKRSRPGHSAQSRYHAYQYAASPTADLAMAARSDAQQAIMHLQTPTQRFELSQSQLQAGVTIGRAAQAVISLAHPAVSSQHLRIFLRGKQLYIQDLGSRYGTSVNGVVLPAHQDMPVELPAKLMLADLDCLLSGTDIIAPRPVAAHVQAAALCWLRLADSQNERTLNSVTLATRPCSLGRADDNDYVIKHPSVSSHHGQIFYQHPNWFYQDLGSSYGSSIESSAQRTTLQPGSPVKLEGAAKLYLADFAIRISIVPTGES